MNLHKKLQDQMLASSFYHFYTYAVCRLRSVIHIVTCYERLRLKEIRGAQVIFFKGAQSQVRMSQEYDRCLHKSQINLGDTGSLQKLVKLCIVNMDNHLNLLCHYPANDKCKRTAFNSKLAFFRQFDRLFTVQPGTKIIDAPQNQTGTHMLFKYKVFQFCSLLGLMEQCIIKNNMQRERLKFHSKSSI